MTEIDEIEKDNYSIKQQILNLQNEIKKFKSDMYSNNTILKTDNSEKEDNKCINNINTNNTNTNTNNAFNVNTNNNNVNTNDNTTPIDLYIPDKNTFKFSFNNVQLAQMSQNNNNDDNTNNINNNYNYYRNSNATFKESNNNINNNPKSKIPFINQYNPENEEDEEVRAFPSKNNNINNTITKTVKADMNEYFAEDSDSDYNNNKENNIPKKDCFNDSSSISLKDKLNTYINNYVSLKEYTTKEDIPISDKKNFYQKSVEKIRKEKDMIMKASKMPISYNEDDYSCVNDDKMIIDELDKDYNNKQKNNNTNIYKNNDYSQENSLDEKIKKLQQKKFTVQKAQKKNIKNNTNKLSNNSNKNNNTPNLNRTKSIGKFNRVLTKPQTNTMRTCKSKSKVIFNSNNNNTTRINEIKNYQNEIASLKVTITHLRNENEKLRNLLNKEKSQNDKFRKLTEEIIKHYEQTKKI